MYVYTSTAQPHHTSNSVLYGVHVGLDDYGADSVLYRVVQYISRRYKWCMVLQATTVNVLIKGNLGIKSIE